MHEVAVFRSGEDCNSDSDSDSIGESVLKRTCQQNKRKWESHPIKRLIQNRNTYHGLFKDGLFAEWCLNVCIKLWMYKESVTCQLWEADTKMWHLLPWFQTAHQTVVRAFWICLKSWLSCLSSLKDYLILVWLFSQLNILRFKTCDTGTWVIINMFFTENSIICWTFCALIYLQKLQFLH